MSSNILLNNAWVRFQTHIWNEQNFPIRFRNTQLNHQDYALNIHENLELLFFLDGEGYVLYDGVRYAVRGGDVVAVNSYSVHQLGTDSTLNQVCLTLGQDFCQANNIDPSQLQFQHVIRDDPQAIALFRQVIHAHETPGDFQKAMIKAASLDLLLHMCIRYSTPRPNGPLHKDHSVMAVYRAIQFIRENLSGKLTADRVATSAGLSKFHFLREFKRITGYTLTGYLTAVRCIQARSLLESGRYSVKEVAVLCGFADSAYFCRVFRQNMGLRPTELQPTAKSGAGEEQPQES